MIDRIKRLETLFLEEINTLITKMAANGDFGGFVTITAVRLSKDLRLAKFALNSLLYFPFSFSFSIT